MRDDEAFLSIVTPEPLQYYLVRHAKVGALYDRLVFIRGTPGSGKTTLARLFEYPTLVALVRNQNFDVYRRLVAILRECRALQDQQPLLLACRLPLETDYREIWEFPYPDEQKTTLLLSLLQARTILAWLRHLEAAGTDLAEVSVVTRIDSEAAVESIGGTSAPAVQAHARKVEAAIYKLLGSLVPPPLEKLPGEAMTAYRAFDVIERIKVTTSQGSSELLPLVILDDAQYLHPLQFDGLQRSLVHRELRVARWILTRFDVMHPQEALRVVSLEDEEEKAHLPGITATRDTTEVMLQSGARQSQRQHFRKMAKDMAKRYLRRMPLFYERDLNDLGTLLSTAPDLVGEANLRSLRESITKLKVDVGITASRFVAIETLVDKYLKTAGVESETDVRLSMIRILLHRYGKRTPQREFFEELQDQEPSRPLTANAEIYDGARIHLLADFGRPFHFGIDQLCDVSSENAEQFLRLAGKLVEALANRITRGKTATLDATQQQTIMRQRAQEMMDRWDFPHSAIIRRLVAEIAEKCQIKSREANAPLGAGANAYGIPQRDFEELPMVFPALANVLKFSVAYNAITLVPRYECKNQMWCLLELGGVVLLQYGLTTKRGGFIEGSTAALTRAIASERK